MVEFKEKEVKKPKTIRETIEEMKYTTERFITLQCIYSEYHPMNTEFYFSDLAKTTVEEFISNELLNLDAKNKREYIKNGCRCVCILFDDRKE